MKLNIPAELQDIFQRLMEFVPPETRRDINFNKTTLAYLSLGGEALARRHIESSRMGFPDGSLLFEYTAVTEIVTEDADESEPESESDDR